MALGIVIFQVVLAFSFAPELADPKATYHSVAYPDEWLTNPPDFSGWLGRYRRFNEWDSLHYLSIAAHGYRRTSTPPVAENIHAYRDNQAFFPAFPVMAGQLSQWTGISPEVALPLTAQILAVFCWAFFLLLMREFGIARPRALRAALAVLCFPTAFYLVMPYTESTFIAGLLGWIYALVKISRQPAYGLLAAPMGFLMTAARIVGSPLVALPYFFADPHRGRLREWSRASLLAAAASLGIFSFFAFLQWKFDDWHLHFLVQKTGYGNSLDYFWFLRPSLFFPNIWRDTWFNNVSRMCVPIFAVILGFTWWKVFNTASPEVRRIRVGLMVAASTLYFIPCAAKAGIEMYAMVRYFFPVYALLVLVWLLDPSQRWPLTRPNYRYILLAALQLVFMYRYLHGNAVS